MKRARTPKESISMWLGKRLVRKVGSDAIHTSVTIEMDRPLDRVPFRDV